MTNSSINDGYVIAVYYYDFLNKSSFLIEL